MVKEIAMICYDCKEESLEGKTRCAKHHALALANGKLWRERNPDKAKASRQKYYQKNKEVIKENSKEWARNNKERKAIKSKEWAKNNPNKVLNSRMKKFNITADEYNQRLLDQDHKCAICNSDNPRGRG